jgi:hypothetical protein
VTPAALRAAREVRAALDELRRGEGHVPLMVALIWAIAISLVIAVALAAIFA